MPEEWIYADTIMEAVQRIIPYLEDTGSRAHKAIYFDGWFSGLGASAVLRAIAEDPPPSLRKKFDKIIHVDCSKWKSRRALQRAIAEELKLPQRVMAVFDRQDEEDDFSGVDEGSRDEIEDVKRKILGEILDNRYLVVFHNGSNHIIDLNDFGVPPPEWLGSKLLWTFRGRLRFNPKIKQRVDKSHLHLYVRWVAPIIRTIPLSTINALLIAEARDIARYTQHKQVIDPEIATQCCLYLLSLNSKGGNIMDYNWATHASNYWVCDGIIQGGQFDEAIWEVAAALHQQIRIEDYSSNRIPHFAFRLNTPKRWILVTYSNSEQNRETNVLTVPPESTSFFLAIQSQHPSASAFPESTSLVVSLPKDMFLHSDKLHVLKLCRCTFSFCSPPFCCCHSLRFLGLDDCKDQPQKEEEEKRDRPAMEFFQSLWVLDICDTDWELALFPEIIEQMAANIREVHIKKGRIWRSNLAWRRLQMLCKLRITEPTSSWETDQKDEFSDMGKLELLDLSRNSTMKVLPSLSGAIGLKTLVLDGCVELDHVGPEGLPPSLESFSLDAGTKISRISLAGCAKLLDFSLRGPLPNLEDLDLSDTAIKTLDLKSEVVHVPRLQQIILLGCELLRSILWPKKGMQQLRMLRIDTRGEVRKSSPGAPIHQLPEEYCDAYVAIMDMKFIQSLVLRSGGVFCWIANRFNLALCMSATGQDNGQWCKKEKTGRYSTGRVIGPPLHKLSIPKISCSTYTNVSIDKITTHHDDSSAPQFEPLDRHLEIGEGINNTNVESLQGFKAIIFVMNEVESLHVHDNSSITTVIAPRMMSIGEEKNLTWLRLKQCRVERCPKLDAVFTINYDVICFEELETLWVADLLMAHCIWSKGRSKMYVTVPGFFRSYQTAFHLGSFAKLRSIHLHSCLRLVFVLPLSWNAPGSYFPNLETLHIVYCGDLRQVFPVKEIATDHPKGVLEFPKLKHIYLHELPSLQQICEAKMSAPMLETVRVRGCWSLRRLPAVDRHRQGSLPIVNCERNWWEKLEWDGLQAGHDPSLFKPCHSQYYKKALCRGSFLR